MSTSTSKFLTSFAIPTRPRQGGRPARDPRIEHLAGSGLVVDLMSQGASGYAGDDDDPRPVRPRSLYDLKKWMADYFPSARNRDALPEVALYFAFRGDRVKMPLAEAVPVPLEDLWWLAASGDTLFLSDTRTHHYISVYNVNAEANRIQLLDPWPDRVFLKKGLNLRGVEAVIEPLGAEGKQISITHDEFLRVAVGLITKDTPQLIEDYVAYRRGARDEFEAQLAFGLALMDAEMYVLAPFAAAYLKTALRLAEAAHWEEKAKYAAARLYVALISAVYDQGGSGDSLAAKPFEDELRNLKALHPEDRLLADARSAELCSLSHAAGGAKDYISARRFLDLAVVRFPREEEPRRLRSKVRVLMEDYFGAVEDATEALALNEDRIRDLEEQRDSWHPGDRYSRSYDEARIAGLKERRFDELDMRATALIALRQLSEARTVAEELIAHAPDRSAGYSKLAAIEEFLGNDAIAIGCLRQAREHEKDPRIRAQMDALLLARAPALTSSGLPVTSEEAGA